MSETQSDLFTPNTQTLDHDFLNTTELYLTTGMVSERSSSKVTTSPHSTPTTSQMAVDPSLFDIAMSPSKQTAIRESQALETLLCPSDRQQSGIPTMNDWPQNGEKAAQTQEPEDNEKNVPATQSAEADLAFLLDAQCPMLPLSGTPPVLGKQIRDELDALLQSKEVIDMDNLNTSGTVGSAILGAPEPRSGGSTVHSPKANENDSSQLLQSAMYFMPKTCYNYSLPGQPLPPTQAVEACMAVSEPKNSRNDTFDSPLASRETGSAPVNGGTKRSFAAAAVAAVGGRRNLDGAEGVAGEAFNQERGQRGRKRVSSIGGDRKSAQKVLKTEERGNSRRVWKATECVGMAMPQISEEELRKMRRVKNRASVEKCRTKQRLRMEALQVEQKCLMNECAMIKETLGKVENALREACRYGHLLGVPDQVRERVNVFLGVRE